LLGHHRIVGSIAPLGRFVILNGCGLVIIVCKSSPAMHVSLVVAKRSHGQPWADSWPNPVNRKPFLVESRQASQALQASRVETWLLVPSLRRNPNPCPNRSPPRTLAPRRKLQFPINMARHSPCFPLVHIILSTYIFSTIEYT